MSNALSFIYTWITQLTNFIFNSMYIDNNVTVGWVVVVIIVFSIVISSVLNLPRGMAHFDKFRAHAYKVNTYDGAGNLVKRGYVKKKRV